MEFALNDDGVIVSAVTVESTDESSVRAGDFRDLRLEVLDLLGGEIPAGAQYAQAQPLKPRQVVVVDNDAGLTVRVCAACQVSDERFDREEAGRLLERHTRIAV